MSRCTRIRKRRERDEDVTELDEQLEPQTATAAPAGPADRALDLQKAAGNRATGAAIHRWAGPWLHQLAQWPKTIQLRIGSYAFPIASMSFEKAELLYPHRDGSGGMRWILTDVSLSPFSLVGSDANSPVYSVRLSFRKRELSDKPR
jgi:hypothetical protein